MFSFLYPFHKALIPRRHTFGGFCFCKSNNVVIFLLRWIKNWCYCTMNIYLFCGLCSQQIVIPKDYMKYHFIILATILIIKLVLKLYQSVSINPRLHEQFDMPPEGNVDRCGHVRDKKSPRTQRIHIHGLRHASMAGSAPPHHLI